MSDCVERWQHSLSVNGVTCLQTKLGQSRSSDILLSLEQSDYKNAALCLVRPDNSELTGADRRKESVRLHNSASSDNPCHRLPAKQSNCSTFTKSTSVRRTGLPVWPVDSVSALSSLSSTWSLEVSPCIRKGTKTPRPARSTDGDQCQPSMSLSTADHSITVPDKMINRKFT